MFQHAYGKDLFSQVTFGSGNNIFLHGHINRGTLCEQKMFTSLLQTSLQNTWKKGSILAAHKYHYSVLYRYTQLQKNLSLYMNMWTCNIWLIWNHRVHVLWYYEFH